MTICRHCSTSWSGTKVAHCATCHRTFSTPANFDRHRAGMKDSAVKQGECHDPALNGLVVNERGHWSAPNDGYDAKARRVSA